MSAPHPSPPLGYNLLSSWTRLVVRFRWLALLTTALATAGFVYATQTQLEVDTSVEAFLATQSDAFARLEELRDDFGRDEMFMVIVEGEVFSLRFLSRLRALHQELASIDLPLESLGQRKRLSPKRQAGPSQQTPEPFGDFGEDEGWGDEKQGSVIEEVTSLINTRRTQLSAGSLVVGGLLDEWPSEQDLPAIEQFALHEPAIVGRLLSADGRFTLLTVRTDFMNEEDSNRVYKEVNRIVDKHRAQGFKLRVGGIPALTAAMNTLMLGDLAKMASWAMALIVAIMVFTFRHPIGVIGPVAVVVQSVFWCFGAMGMAGVKMTIISNILPAFILCVGIGDSVHILSVYRDARRDGMNNHQAIIHAVASTGTPVIFTTLTTCIGLLSFRIAAVDAIRDMGTFGAFGVAMALVHSMVFLPAVLTFNHRSLLGLSKDLERDRQSKRDLLDRFIAGCNGLSRPTVTDGKRVFARRNVTLVVAFALTMVAGMLATTLEVYHNPVSWVPSTFAVRDAFDTMDEHLGGTADVTVLIEARPGNTIRDRQLMLGLERLESHAKLYEDPRRPQTIGSVISAVNVIKESHRATHGGSAREYRVPDCERGVSDMLTLFENAGPDQLRRLATVDLTRTIMVMRAKWMDATAYAPMVAHLQRGVDEYIGDGAVVELTGAILNVLTIVSGLLMDLLRSFGTAFLAITLVMVLLLRDLRLGLVSMVPNLLPVVCVMGFMGATGIPIDLNTILLGSIAIGIAVDDTIHFLYQFRDHYQRSADVEASIEHAFAHAGRAIVTTSVILAIGFAVFTAADMYNIVRFGLLISLTLTVAVLVDLVFTPALLRLVYTPTPAETSNES